MKWNGIRGLIGDFKSLLYTEIIKRREVNPFIIFISFIITFILARNIVNFFPEWGLVINGYKVHHVYYGIALLAISNWISLASQVPRLLNISAILFGAGLGLITDEIGLLLTCSSDGKICDYYARQSYDLLIILTLLFFILIYLPPVWEKLKNGIKS